MLHDPVGVSYTITALAFGWIAHLTWHRRDHSSPLARSLSVVMLGLAVSAAADAVAVSATSERAAAVASLAILPGVGVAAGAFLSLAVGCLLPQWVPSRSLIAWLLVEPIAVAAAAATNSWHQWVYSGQGTAELTGSATWLHNDGFWWHAGYSYLLFGIGVVLIAWSWWTSPAAFRLY